MNMPEYKFRVDQIVQFFPNQASITKAKESMPTVNPSAPDGRQYSSISDQEQSH